MSEIETTLAAERTWLERILTSKVIGFCVLDENRTLVQCIDDDPDLRAALIEYKQHRIHELENSAGHLLSPVRYPVQEPVENGYYGGDESLSVEEARAIFSTQGPDQSERYTTEITNSTSA